MQDTLQYSNSGNIRWKLEMWLCFLRVYPLFFPFFVLQLPLFHTAVHPRVSFALHSQISDVYPSSLFHSTCLFVTLDAPLHIEFVPLSAPLLVRPVVGTIFQPRDHFTASSCSTWFSGAVSAWNTLLQNSQTFLAFEVRPGEDIRLAHTHTHTQTHAYVHM